MNTEESGLRGKQESAISVAAREALDRDNVVTTLSLLETATMFLPQNLITIMMAIGFQARNHHDKKLLPRARALFEKYLSLCDNAKSLNAGKIWACHPKRSLSIPTDIKRAIDLRRLALEPDWNGDWENPGVGASNLALTIITKQPEEITDPAECLVGASQSQLNNFDQWMKRYLDLGGNPMDPQYLKIWAARGTNITGRVSKFMVKKLRDFIAVGNRDQVKKFLRNITPTRHYDSTLKNPNNRFARYALLLYCMSERLEHTEEDWVHIAKSAMFLNLPIVERIVQRILAGLVSTRGVREAFSLLCIKNGTICVTQNHEEDLGLGNNPLWRSVHKLIPVNADARRILFAYSGFELRRIEAEDAE